MSSYRNSTQKKNAVAVKKYCKVCHDAGKSEAEYTSHFVRENPDPNSKVVCPYLLSLECSYCFKNGHTAAYCPIKKQNLRNEKREEGQKQRQELEEKSKNEKKTQVKKSNNIFAAFDSDSDSEMEEKVVLKVLPPSPIQVSKSVIKIKEEFPALVAPVSKSFSNTTKSVAKVTPGCVKAIESCCPMLKIGKQTPQINIPTPVLAQLVRRPKEEPKEVVRYTETIADLIEEAEIEYKPRKPQQFASMMDWANPELDSDDEDW